MLLNGGKLQRPPTTRESGVDDKPSGNHHHSRKGPTNQSYSAFAFCSAAGSALHVDSSDKSQGYQAHCPKHSTWSSARSAWSPRWPTARAPAAARLPSCNKVGPCCRLLPWYVLSHLWANDKMGLDGTGWLLCFRHPACSSPARTSTRPVARFLSPAARVVPRSRSILPAPSATVGGTSLQIYIALVLPTPAFIYPYMLPRLPYSRPHEPEHSPASFKSSTSKQISCTSRLLHPPRFVRTPDSSVFDSSTRLDRQRHAARPSYSPSLPKHKGSAATSDTTTPNHAYNSPSPPPPVASTPSGTFGA